MFIYLLDITVGVEENAEALEVLLVTKDRTRTTNALCVEERKSIPKQLLPLSVDAEVDHGLRKVEDGVTN